MRNDDYDDDATVVIEKQSGSVGSFLVGLAIGAGVALLFAPRSGAETRQAIGRRARDARDRTLDMADELTHEVTDRVGRARDAVTDRVDRARQAVDLKRRQVTRAVEAGRVAAQQAREDLERRIAETKAAYQAGARVTREELDRGRRRPGLAAAAGLAGAGDVDPDLLGDDDRDDEL